jgi:hypothetical protein
VFDGVHKTIRFVPKLSVSRAYGPIIPSEPRIPVTNWVSVSPIDRSIEVLFSKEIRNDSFIFFDKDFVYEGDGKYCLLLVNPRFPEPKYPLDRQSSSISVAAQNIVGHIYTMAKGSRVTFKAREGYLRPLGKLFLETITVKDSDPHAKICYSSPLPADEGQTTGSETSSDDDEPSIRLHESSNDGIGRKQNGL